MAGLSLRGIYKKYPGRVLTIEVNELDYLHRPEDLKDIIDQIDALLFGLFPLSDSEKG